MRHLKIIGDALCLTVGEKEGEVHWTWDKNKYQCVREKDEVRDS